MQRLNIFLAFIGAAQAYPWVAKLPDIDTSLLRGGYHGIKTKRDDPTCPFNPEHTGAAPFNPLFPYSGAVGGLPRTLPGGNRVPAEGDTAHYYTPPSSLDIRGPCPGV